MALTEVPAFREYGVETPREVLNLHNRLQKRVDELTGQLVLSSDWADHRYRVGVIRGLTEAIDILRDRVERK